MSNTSTQSEQAKLRKLSKGLGGRVALGAVGKALGLPRATTRYTVNQVRVPMRDGVDLVAEHYAPATGAPAGTLLARGPYGRGFPFALFFARIYAARGYHVILQSVRGTFGSGGEFDPMVNEAADGADTVEWLRRQPWFTGRFATVGLSYLGFTQWALLAAAVITVGPHDFNAAVWDTGSFTNEFLGWSDLVAHQENSSLIRAGIRQATSHRRLARAVAQLPMGAAARTMLGDGAPWFESWVEHVDPTDPFWDRLRFPDALDRVAVPVLLLSGWQDIFLRQTLQQYRHLRDRDVDVAMTVGPWTHAQMVGKALPTCAPESLDWLNTHLGAQPGPRPGGAPPARRRRSRVHVFVTGVGWRDLPDWPPRTAEHVLYLQPYGRLGETPPTLKTAAATFRYDPAYPTPTTGGPLLAPRGGYRDDTRLALRDDVLTFTGSPLSRDLDVYGSPVVELTRGSDNPHVDLFVRVSEVDLKGRSRNVSDGYRRLQDTAAGVQTVRIELDAVAHRFKAGSRIRVLITGSWSPRYARNLGTSEPMLTGRRLEPARHAVHFGSSRLLLPVGAAAGSADGVADATGRRATRYFPILNGVRPK